MTVDSQIHDKIKAQNNFFSSKFNSVGINNTDSQKKGKQT